VEDERERLRSRSPRSWRSAWPTCEEIDQVSHRVTAEALKVRASQLGEIEEITEDPHRAR
jgi:hypothetical protein